MAYPKTYESVIELIDKSDKQKRIVELGCGRGEIVQELRKLGFNNISYCDIKNRFDNKVKIMDLNKKFDYDDNLFDIAIATEIIEHLENKYHFFREVRRILKPNGILIFSTPNISNIPNKVLYLLKGRFIEFNEKMMPKHINPFFHWELANFFKVEKITYNRGFIPILRIPFLKNSLFGQTIIIKCRAEKKIS